MTFHNGVTMRLFTGPSPWRQVLTLVGIIGIFSAVTAEAQQTDDRFLKAIESISTERMLADIRALSDPSFNGRQTGTDDDRLSAQWVAQEFLSAGLFLPFIPNGQLSIPFFTGKRGGPGGFMASLVPTPIMSPDPALRIGAGDRLSTASLGTDYLPIFDAPSADLQGRIIFVGYGIVDQAQGIDDYANVDVNNAVVLFLRGNPDHVKSTVSHADKVRFARDRGAVAYLTATGPILHPYEARRGVTGSPSAFYAQMSPDQAIPGAWINTALAEQILAEPNNANRLRTLQEQINKAPSSDSVQTSHYASLRWKTQIQEGVMVNVVGMLAGTGPGHIIIGAHRDHFGRPAGLLFPGADDNASGTAVILEVARVLLKIGLQPHPTILFVSFSGEERDLLGSRLYTSRPRIPLNETKAMINVDHAGIGNGRLTVGVTGFEKSVATEAGQAVMLTDKLDVYGFFPGSDHVPFKEAGVPTITIVSGGTHPHFHQPTDKADTINPEILQTVARYVLALAWQLAKEP
jgi:Peptidase family M28